MAGFEPTPENGSQKPALQQTDKPKIPIPKITISAGGDDPRQALKEVGGKDPIELFNQLSRRTDQELRLAVDRRPKNETGINRSSSFDWNDGVSRFAQQVKNGEIFVRQGEIYWRDPSFPTAEPQRIDSYSLPLERRFAQNPISAAIVVNTFSEVPCLDPSRIQHNADTTDGSYLDTRLRELHQASQGKEKGEDTVNISTQIPGVTIQMDNTDHRFSMSVRPDAGFIYKLQQRYWGNNTPQPLPSKAAGADEIPW